MAEELAEERLVLEYFYKLFGDDIAERLDPNFHRNELVGLTAKGRSRSVRVDNQGRLVLAPGLEVKLTELIDLNSQVLSAIKDVRLGLSIQLNQDLTGQG